MAALLPGSALGEVQTSDKLLHFLSYMGLAGLPAWRRSGWSRLLLVGVGCSLLGLALEFIQQWVPGRSFEWNDQAANVTGAGAGIVVARALRRINFP